MLPAIFLLVFSLLWLMYGTINLAYVMLNPAMVEDPNLPADMMVARKIGFYGAAFGIPVTSLIVVVGSIFMLLKRLYFLAVTGAVVAIIPCLGPCVVLGIPFGVWALIVLLRPQVKDSFR